MSSARHEALITQLCQQDGWMRGLGWKLAVGRKVMEAPFHGEEGEDGRMLAQVFKGSRFNPDAYRLKVEDEREGWGHPVLVVELAEIVVSHDIPPNKLDVIEKLWWACDATEYVHLRLHVMDRYGRMDLVMDQEPIVSG
jgi:hypothetical protein